VEDFSLAFGAIIGYESIKSASRMNTPVVIFLDYTVKVNTIVKSGVVLRDTQTSVFPLINLTKKVVLSNVRPFVGDEMLEREFESWSTCIYNKKVILGCKSPLLKHVMSHRRQVHMKIKKDTD
jgi:hypothetical protein